MEKVTKSLVNDDSSLDKAASDKTVYSRVFFPHAFLEVSAWLFLGIIIMWPFLFSYPLKLDILISRLLISVSLVLFPLLFKLVFGLLPIAYLRLIAMRSSLDRTSLEEMKVYDANTVTLSDVHVNLKTKNGEFKQNTDYLKACTEESKAIAERVFARSGVYLLIGSLIAFIGVGLFIYPLLNNDIIIFNKDKQLYLYQIAVGYLPRFGLLFFVEFIAFFFLKQYRIMLEEYRYYESIKRRRQDDLSLLELIEKYKDQPDVLKVVTERFTQTTVNKLASGETTEILETQKIVNQDMDLLAKLTELVKTVKAK